MSRLPQSVNQVFHVKEVTQSQDQHFSMVYADATGIRQTPLLSCSCLKIKRAYALDCLCEEKGPAVPIRRQSVLRFIPPLHRRRLITNIQPAPQGTPLCLQGAEATLLSKWQRACFCHGHAHAHVSRQAGGGVVVVPATCACAAGMRSSELWHSRHARAFSMKGGPFLSEESSHGRLP